MRARDRRVLRLQRLRKEYEKKLQENAGLMEKNAALKQSCDALKSRISVFYSLWIYCRNRSPPSKKWRRKRRELIMTSASMS